MEFEIVSTEEVASLQVFIGEAQEGLATASSGTPPMSIIHGWWLPSATSRIARSL